MHQFRTPPLPAFLRKGFRLKIEGRAWRVIPKYGLVTAASGPRAKPYALRALANRKFSALAASEPPGSEKMDSALYIMAVARASPLAKAPGFKSLIEVF